MAGRHILLHLIHFLGIVFIINISNSILPTYVTNFFFKLSNLLICVCVTQLTLGISKKIFFSGRLKPERRAVLITGCAKGIGNALAKHLDSKGFHVFASCRDPSTPGADDLRRSCSSRLHIFQLDVANDESVRKALQLVRDNLGTCELWAVINNAGIQKGFLLELTSIQDFKDSLEVNAVGPARVTKTFLPLLRQSKGRVINIASLLGRLAFPMAGPYSMSKFACVGFSESLRYELDFFGVKVISIEPEFFQTDMTTEKGISQRIDSMFAKVDEDVRKDYGEEFLKAFQHTASTLFPPSPNMQKLVETVEDAVSLKHPDAVYKVCRNVGVRALWTVMDVLPAEFKVFLERIVYNLLGIPKPGQAKKGMKILVKCI